MCACVVFNYRLVMLRVNQHVCQCQSVCVSVVSLCVCVSVCVCMCQCVCLCVCVAASFKQAPPIQHTEFIWR